MGPGRGPPGHHLQPDGSDHPFGPCHLRHGGKRGRCDGGRGRFNGPIQSGHPERQQRLHHQCPDQHPNPQHHFHAHPHPHPDSQSHSPPDSHHHFHSHPDPDANP